MQYQLEDHLPRAITAFNLYMSKLQCIIVCLREDACLAFIVRRVDFVHKVQICVHYRTYLIDKHKGYFKVLIIHSLTHTVIRRDFRYVSKLRCFHH